MSINCKIYKIPLHFHSQYKKQIKKQQIFLSASNPIWTFLIPQLIKNLPAMQETWVRFLGWDDPLEKEMATHSSILAWEIPWTEEPDGLYEKGSAD